MAAPEVSDPPEVTGPEEDAENPAGKSDAGSSTDSSSVPVSCPEAAASGVIDAVGSGRWGVGAVRRRSRTGGRPRRPYGMPLVAQPVTVASRPTATARTVNAGRAPATGNVKQGE